jgi:CelD/BcsL family acetyltransferase involved in cellulose biosynthesis
MFATLVPALTILPFRTMNVVALHTTTKTGHRSVPAVAGRIARVEVFDDMEGAEPHWRALERAHALATPYQRFEFLSLWQQYVGVEEGFTPFIVVGFDVLGTPLFLLPLGARPMARCTVIEFLGGKHANFNMGLWRRDMAAAINGEALRAVLDRLAGRADAMLLRNQSLTWEGATNPFALLPHQRAANHGFSGALAPDFESLLRARTNAATRKKMRKKERTLAGYGAVRFERAETPAQISRVLDAFFKQKGARMQRIGVTDVFAEADVRRFVEAAAAQRLADGNPLIELYSLSVDDIIAATMGGIAGDGRFCGMFNSIIDGPYAVESPGEQLILNLVRLCCERGLATFDLGIGDAHYKNLFCGDAEPLFDSFLPLSRAGRLLAPAAAFTESLKRAIKQHAMLWSMVRGLRRLRARFSAA